MTKENIISKIKALLEKNTSNGASENEALTALKKAKELMVKYLISEEDLKSSENEIVFVEVEKYKYKYKLSGFLVDMCNLFDCVIIQNCKTKNYFIFGTKQDVELCEYFYHYLTRMIIFEKEKFLQTDDAFYMMMEQNKATVSSSFINGFIIGLNKKLRILYQEKLKEVDTSVKNGSELVITRQEKAKEFVRDYFNNDISKGRASKLNAKIKEAYLEGVSKGINFNIAQGLSDKRKADNLILS